MYQEIDDGRTVIVRKDRHCEWCGETIHKGEKCIKRTYRFDGEFNDARQHPECFEAMKRDPYSREGFEAGAQRRGMTIGETEEVQRREIEEEEEHEAWKWDEE